MTQQPATFSRRFTHLILSVLAIACSDGAGAVATPDQASSEQQKPNILILLADDLGNNDIRAFNNAQDIDTPNMDAIAQEGTRFTRFYTESTCMPSRAALLTGRYPARAGFRPTGRGIPPHLTTLPEALRIEGYATHHVGKWHLGSTVETAWPLAQGFDSSFGFLNQWTLREQVGNARPLTYPTYNDPWLQRDNGPRQRFEGHLTDVLTEHTVGLIEDANSSTPWFIFHAFFAPHTPIEPAPRFASKYPDTKEGKFKALLKQLDVSVGRIMESLRSTGQLKNTIVVLASDNGGVNAARNNNAPYPGKKRTYLDGGVRVPLVLHWPKAFSPGARVDEPVAIFDLYPTLMDLVGSERATADLDGVSLVKARSDTALLRRDLFWEMSSFNRLIYRVQTSDDALLIHNQAGETRVIDLNKNPNGERGSAGDTSDPKQTRALRDRYVAWRDDAREVETNWTPSPGSGHGKLSGDDFQRSPGLGGYTFAIAVTPAKQSKSKRNEQVIVHQRGLFLITLGADRRVRAEIDGVVLESKPIDDEACHSIVFTAEFNRSLSPSSALRSRVSVLKLFVDNDYVDLDSSTQPLPKDTDLSAPTYIGSNSRGERRFHGTLGRAVILNQALTEVDSDSAAGVGDRHAEMCPPQLANTPK